MKVGTVLMFSIFLLYTVPSGYCDQIRGTLSHDVEIPPVNGVAASFSLSLEEIAAVRLSSAYAPIVRAIEFEIRVPREAEPYMDGFACLIYHSVRPEPSDSVRFYQGSQLGYTILPSQGRLYIRLPLPDDQGPPPSPGTVVFDVLNNPDNLPLVLTLLPFMKGIPDSVYTLSFPIKVYPILRDLGLITLDIKDASGELPETASVYIDDSRTTYPLPSRYTLRPGIHTLHVEASGYLPIDRTFSIEGGTISTVSAVLEKGIPLFTVEAPRDSRVFLDGEQLLPPYNHERELTEGEHTILYSIGDYSISRKFTAEPGKTYKIELLLDILIENY